MGTSKSRHVHVALSADEISGHRGLHAAIGQQSRMMQQAYDGNPRLSSVFATQHRWLMGQAALALHFRALSAGDRGVSAARILALIAEHDVASHNTADAFLKEMVKYGWARQVPDAGDRRTRPIEPTEASIDAIHGWIGIHLATLDRLDHSRRLDTYLGTPGALAALHPGIADGLLSSSAVRQPEKTFSLFTWLNNGGLVMDWLIAGIEETDPDAERVATAVVSIGALAQRLKLSRTHLARKLKEAEALGSVGWHGKRGHSVMWVSSGFRREYAMAQAAKLAIIDAAFAACFRQPCVGALPALPGFSSDSRNSVNAAA